MSYQLALVKSYVSPTHMKPNKINYENGEIKLWQKNSKTLLTT